MRLITATALLLTSLLSAQIDEKAQHELDHVFDRTAGVIKQEQKDKLAAWLQRHEGQDLGDFGYVVALKYYLDRDYPEALASLDEFFKAGHHIANDEHRHMAGRVFLSAVATEVRLDKPDLGKVVRWSEAMTRLYPEPTMLERIGKSLLERVSDPAAVRIAMARGVVGSELTTAQQDAFLQGIYQGAAAPAGTVPAARIRAQPATTARDNGSVQPGQPVETFAVDRVVNGPAKFDLDSCKGKVVVLDFFASWCPPCRAALSGMVQLQKEHPDDVQVVGVTRYYGHGMDFSAADAKVPHGGKTVKELDHDQEGALYAPLVKAFELNYPIVFTADQELAAQKFGVTGIPTMFVIGRDGKLVGSVVGTNEEKHKELLEMVAEARK